MAKNETNDGRKGGLLKGKPHYDKNGKPLGGIKAIVTDTNTKVELEGGEVIINKHASRKYWRELSKINQSAGNGVPIKNPNGNSDDDPEEYKDGGRIIQFNPNHTPSKIILNYAKKIKAEYPKVWDKGGNIFGNEAFNNLKRVSDRGYWLDSEKWMYIKWRSYVARHKQDFRINGVVAMLKWVDKVNKGWDYMKKLIEAEIEKQYPKQATKKVAKMEKGGNLKNDCIGFINNSEAISKNGYYLHLKNLNNYVDAGDKTISNIKSLVLITYNSGGQSNLKVTDTINASELSYKISELLDCEISVARIIVSEQIKYAKRFSLNVVKNIENENIIIADRDKIVCTNINKEYAKGGLIAPNGKPSNLTTEQYKLVRTPEFKEWFGDWENDPENASKVVDENGEPLVVYHRSKSKKYYFNKDKQLIGWLGKGFYFSPNKDEFKEYGKTILEVFVSAKKMFSIEGESPSDVYTEIKNINKNNSFDESDISKTLKEIGYDGVKFKHWDRGIIISCFESNQIKLADGTNTTFDSNNPDIRFDKGGLIAPNGRKSNLTPEQYKLVRTPEFKAWFGDWENDPENASKIVDENGEPLVVWHGTKSDFYIFGEGKNKHILDEYKDDYDYRKKVNYFHRNKEYTETFGSKYGGYEKPFFLDIKKIELVDEDTIENIGYWKNIYDYNVILKGLDGIFSNSGQYVTLLNPHQIKLADGTNTTFDSNNPDIRFDKGGELKKGIKEELEHIKTAKKLYNKQITPKESAEEIAKDHLKDNPFYYSELSKLSKKMQYGGVVDNSELPFIEQPKPIFWQMTMKQFCDYAKSTKMDTRLEGSNAKLQCEDFYKYTIIKPLLSNDAERNVFLLAIESNRMPYEAVEEIIKSAGLWETSTKKLEEIKQYNNLVNVSDIWSTPKNLYLQKEYFAKNFTKSNANKWYKKHIYHYVFLDDKNIRELIAKGVVKHSQIIDRLRESLGLEILSNNDKKQLDSMVKIESKLNIVGKLNHVIDMIESEKTYSGKTTENNQYKFLFKTREHDSHEVYSSNGNFFVKKWGFKEPYEITETEVKEIARLHLNREGQPQGKPQEFYEARIDDILGIKPITLNLLKNDNAITSELKNRKAREGLQKIVLDEGYGITINDLFNQWNSIKNETDSIQWKEKVKNTKFGTYETIGLMETIKNFNPKLNDTIKRNFYTEIESTLGVPKDQRTYKPYTMEMPTNEETPQAKEAKAEQVGGVGVGGENKYLSKGGNSSNAKIHNIDTAKSLLSDLGVDASFSGYSDTNGVSVYFTDNNGKKIRVSNHGVTNKHRIANEVLLSFDTKTLGFGGKEGFKSYAEQNKKAVEQYLKETPQAGSVYFYSAPNKYNSEIKVGQKYYDSRYGDYYTIEKMTKVEGGDVDVEQKYDRGKTRTESGDFILYHIDGKQHSLSKNDSIIKAESISPEKENFVKKVIELTKSNTKFNKVKLEKLASEYGIEEQNLVKELTELAISLMAREIAHMNDLSEKEKYDTIVELYKNQSNLSHRTSQSIMMMQYSTPAPIGYLMGLYCGISKSETKYFEPSAGNGLLTIAGDIKNATINEKDFVRANNLKYIGFNNVTSEDASKSFPEYEQKFDAVITNPPFGTIEPVFYGKYKITSLEQLMALRGLDTMKDDGKAAIIIGGHMEYDSEGRLQAGKNRIFFVYLYENYNIEDVININGAALYSRQGTSFNTRLILINGRKKQPNGYFPLNTGRTPSVDPFSKTPIDNFDDLWERVTNHL